MMTWKNKSAFTLVELIVVITILAILGTIAFISLQWYSKSARDSKRTSDISNIKTSLELFSLATWKYPLPDNSYDVTYSWSVVVWKQWTVWDNVVTNLSRNLSEKPTDPLIQTEYIYSTLENGKEYEILSLYEWDLLSNNSIINSTYASTNWTVRVDGTYNGLFVKTSGYIIPTPSIITSETLPIDFDATKIVSQVIDWWTNVPNVWNSKVTQSTWSLSFSDFQVYTWSISNNSSTWSLLDVYNILADTYSWSSLENIWIIQDLLSKTTDEQKIAITKTVVLNTTSGGGWWPTDWRAQDPNCTIPDITIWNQTWAWCNTTLDTGIEYTDETYCYNYDKDWNWTINNLWTLWDCWSLNYWDSNDNAKDYYDSLAWTGNQNNDIEVDNIWWKLYTWYRSWETDWVNLDNNNDWEIVATEDDEVCPGWYNIPSNDDWATLEQSLWCSDQTNTWWRCDWQWWRYHTTTNSGSSIAEKLKLPLAGFRDTDGSAFYFRGYHTILWSSSPSSSNAYFRNLNWDNSTVNRSADSQDFGFSVRCIKD